MLLELDHGTSTAKLIWLLYQIIHIIPKKQRDNLLIELLAPEQFYKYMFHWSYFVRLAFHYFYYFQLHFILTDSEIVKAKLHAHVTT